MANVSIKKKDRRPWGRGLGLLAGCVFVLAGILAGLSPEVILLRAAAVAFACGIAVTVVRFTIRCLQQS